MEFGIEKCAMRVRKRDKRHMMDRIEVPNQIVIRTLEEKETCKYLGILETVTIKQVEMKEKILKNVSEEPENYSRQNSKAGTFSNG